MKITKENQELYLKALKNWGAQKQIIMCLEEMSELQKELCKNLRYESANRNENKIAEEIADVLITLEQVVTIFGLEETVAYIKNHKLERLKGTL